MVVILNTDLSIYLMLDILNFGQLKSYSATTYLSNYERWNIFAYAIYTIEYSVP